ncbi:hypothetical protein CEN49_19860, partial [Fischerella thermalis CCMEE 5273]
MQGIEIKALSKSYANTKAIDDISIKIDKPGIYLLAGPSSRHWWACDKRIAVVSKSTAKTSARFKYHS